MDVRDYFQQCCLLNERKSRARQPPDTRKTVSASLCGMVRWEPRRWPGQCRVQTRERNFTVCIPSSSKDLPVWPKVTNLLRPLWGRAEITTWTQPHRSCEYNSSPAEKVLENTMLQSFRKMNLSTPLFHAPKLYLPAPWFIQEGETVVKNKRLGSESNFLLVQPRTAYSASV